MQHSKDFDCTKFRTNKKRLFLTKKYGKVPFAVLLIMFDFILICVFFFNLVDNFLRNSLTVLNKKNAKNGKYKCNRAVVEE